MSERRYGYFEISPEMLRSLVGLSEDHQIVGAEWDFGRGLVKVYVTGGRMPIQLEGMYPERVGLEISTESVMKAQVLV